MSTKNRNIIGHSGKYSAGRAIEPPHVSKLRTKQLLIKTSKSMSSLGL
jgi:hypothetical protein